MKSKDQIRALAKSSALHFILLLGTVSLFSDMVYEGARSITGPYLAVLGASGAVVGFVAGFGEALGYILRIFSGWLVDKSGRYWTIALTGYLLNFIAIPLIAFTTSWQAAAALLIIERIGKAIRTPSRDAMLSYASQKVGRGWGFGLHQVFDQLGGMLGPALVTAVIFFNTDYRLAFGCLAIPAALSFIILLGSINLYPYPQDLEVEVQSLQTKKIPKIFWVYLAGSAFIAAGYVDFPLIAFHFQKNDILTPIWIPIFYIVAMGSSAASAMLFGWLYDRYGSKILFFSILLSCVSPALVFIGSWKLALVGMISWGIGIGAQRSLLKAIVGDMVAKSVRGSAYGIFNTGYGIAWFAGSFTMGILYDISLPFLIVFSISVQLLSIPFIYIVQRKGYAHDGT